MLPPGLLKLYLLTCVCLRLKSLPHFTGVGLLVRVHLHVYQQAGLTFEAFAACLAGIRPLARVRPDVAVQYWLLVEPLATHLAGIRPLTRVDPLVNVQYGFLVEAFPADVTRKRPLARVDPLMDLQDGFLVEPLAADVTAVRPHARVDSEVSYQSGLKLKHFPTRIAFIFTLSIDKRVAWSFEQDRIVDVTDSGMRLLQLFPTFVIWYDLDWLFLCRVPVECLGHTVIVTFIMRNSDQ